MLFDIDMPLCLATPPPLSQYTPLVTAISFRRRLVALAGRLQYTAHGDEGVVCHQFDHQGLDHRAPETAQAAPGEVLSLHFLEDGWSLPSLLLVHGCPVRHAVWADFSELCARCPAMERGRASAPCLLLSACCICSYLIQTSAQADRRNYLVARRRMCS